MTMNSLASSLSEIRARAAARFALDDGCVGISMMTFIGLVFVTTDLPSTTETRTAKNFVVLQQEPDPTQ